MRSPAKAASGSWLRSLLFNIGFFVWTSLVVVGGLVLLPLPWPWMHRLGRLWCRGTLVLLRVIVGLDHRIEGPENLLREPAIYASKHQSTWDTLIFALLLPDCAYVLKRELYRVPLFGQLLARSRPIAIDRAAGGSALRRMLGSAERAIEEDRAIVIFPEGTRTAPGDHGRYQPGTAALYQRLGVSVVPVALDSGLYWGRRQFVKRPGTITIRFLSPIAPGLERRDFMATLEGRIETACRALAGPPDSVQRD